MRCAFILAGFQFTERSGSLKRESTVQICAKCAPENLSECFAPMQVAVREGVPINALQQQVAKRQFPCRRIKVVPAVQEKVLKSAFPPVFVYHLGKVLDFSYCQFNQHSFRLSLGEESVHSKEICVLKRGQRWSPKPFTLPPVC